MSLTKIDSSVANISDLSKSIALDPVVGGVKLYVDTGLAAKANTNHNHDASYLKLSGGSLTGVLTLVSSVPTGDWQAAPKKYVDDHVSSAITGLLSLSVADGRYLKLAGGTMSNFLTLNANPTNNLHAATKQYVDVRTGSAQIWHDVSSERTLGTVYHNDTGHAIQIYVTLSPPSGASVNVVSMGATNSASDISFAAPNLMTETYGGTGITCIINTVVPDGYYYKVSSTQSGSAFWTELR